MRGLHQLPETMSHRGHPHSGRRAPGSSTNCCIDCGECIRVCQHHAKVAVTDPFESIRRFQYRVALPAPALYGQFKTLESIAVLASAALRHDRL